MRNQSSLIGLLVFSLFIASHTTFAQTTVALDWSTFDGGGGASSGGAFTLHGTIGQPDAGVMSAGALTIHGGFWGGIVPAHGPQPALAIRHGTGNTVVLTWPNPSPGYVLQQTANMGGPGGGWTDVPDLPVLNGANKEVTLPASGQFCLFRLRHP